MPELVWDAVVTIEGGTPPNLKVESSSAAVEEETPSPAPPADAQTPPANAEERYGFRITGGVDFGMAITVFQVQEGGKAEQVGIRCGDSILKINGKPTEAMTLAQAQKALQDAKDDLKVSVTSFKDDDTETDPEDIREVILGGEKPKPIEVEKPKFKRVVSNEPPKQPWHPVMWPMPSLTQVEDHGDEPPHARIVRNVRRFLTECKDPKQKQHIVESLMLCLPSATRQKEVDPEEEEEERRRLAELRRISLAMRGELSEGGEQNQS